MPADGVAVRHVSEPIRERETYKYDPSLLTTIKYNNSGVPVPTAELVTSPDTVLTGLAQLGACRLQTARSLISLFDKDYQYIVTEATPTIPLTPSLKHEDRDEDLWLCGTAIPRIDGVCEYTLCASERTLSEGDSGTKQLPLALVADLTSDPRFSFKPYCQPGTLARFYAAVPIRTNRGINIGVYCVIDTEPRDVSTWGEKDTQLMCNISRSIMEHLECRRSRFIHARNGRMIRGLGSLVEGKQTLSGWQNDLEIEASDTDPWRRESPEPEAGHPAPTEKRTTSDGVAEDPASSQTLSSLHSPDESASIASAVAGGEITSSPRLLDAQVNSPSIQPAYQEPGAATVSVTNGLSSLTKSHTIQDVFSRAANIARESIETDGVLILDASLGSFGAPSSPPLEPQDEDANSAPPAASDARDGRKGTTIRDLPCRILGVSMSTTKPNTGSAKIPPAAFNVPQAFLSKLLAKYPEGKIFNFDEIGELHSSDSSGEEHLLSDAMADYLGIMSGGGAVPVGKRRKHPVSKQDEGLVIRAIFPGARSVAFVPIWGAKKERWYAGGFAYSYTPARTFTIEEELSYLRAFGMLTMEEAFRIETQLADKAKSDVLSSLSHELRSPLHGIVLATELLNDTELDVFQGNIIHTLETCSRTLLDTLEHMLAFSKVNSHIGRMEPQQPVASQRGFGQDGSPIQRRITNLQTHVRLDALVEEVMESVFAGFNFQHVSLSQFAKRGTGNHADVTANRRLDSMGAMDELGPGLIENGELRLSFEKVTIFLDFDPACSWVFDTQPGAIRRIVMNLFGNSLKYTRRGRIVVSIKQELSRRRRDKLKMVNITISDTGKGIGEDYLRHELFRPFSQEDHIAPGTGLGLSLVKQIVSQLKGTISVDSCVGVGTNVSVSIPLLPGDPDQITIAASEDDAEWTHALSSLPGHRIRLHGFSCSEAVKDTAVGGSYIRLSDDGLTQKIMRDAFKMEVLGGTEDGKNDLAVYIGDASTLQFMKSDPRPAAPSVLICENALVSYHRSSSLSDQAGIFEFISQPISPRKLAQALSRALKRWDEVQQSAPNELSKNPQPVLNESVAFTDTTWRTPVPQAEDSVQAEVSIASIPNSVIASPDVQDSVLKFEDLALASPLTSEEAKQAFLIVDDNPINVKILSSYMKKIGSSYSPASNGLEALETFCRNPARYKCIFMDISMPVMDGFEATRRIRAYERDKGLQPVAIFALSGLASASAQQEAQESGIDLFLTKPVKLKELSLLLQQRSLL